MDPRDALDVARDKGLDLVEVAPDARPPVCKIMDYGKLRYDQTKKKSKPKRQMELKTITLRPKTGEHDLQTKLKHARKFLHRGDKVRFQVRMRGRERAKPQMWSAQLMNILEGLKDIATITQRPAQDGRGISAMIEPLPHAIKKPDSKSPAKDEPEEEYIDDADDDDGNEEE